MSSLIFSFLIWSSLSFAGVSSDVVLKGRVISFDANTVTLIDHGYKISIPKKLWGPSKIVVGENAEIALSRAEYNKLKAQKISVTEISKSN